MAEYKVYDESRDFVGIGKIMIDTHSRPWNIPQLHFLVVNASGEFEAVCLEFGLVSTANTQIEAAEHLVEQVLFYISTVMNEGGKYEELKETAMHGFMNDYWNVYRHLEFCLAEKQRDLSHEIESKIIKAIQETFDEKVREIITTKAKEAADKALEEYHRLAELKVNSVSYFALKDAA
ncbi:MAG: hypothetical protein LBC77_01710 [Spirochaetaceae bacterium]|jgi:hypothetical protein|nr:hypothetical protein [Spirochaetaceae bacterium]